MSKQCPECGKPLAVRKGSKGDFWGCTGYPNCKHTENVSDDDRSTQNEPVMDDSGLVSWNQRCKSPEDWQAEYYDLRWLECCRVLEPLNREKGGHVKELISLTDELFKSIPSQRSK